LQASLFSCMHATCPVTHTFLELITVSLRWKVQAIRRICTQKRTEVWTSSVVQHKIAANIWIYWRRFRDILRIWPEGGAQRCDCRACPCADDRAAVPQGVFVSKPSATYVVSRFSNRFRTVSEIRKLINWNKFPN
jgi:hypothetical protein